MKNEAQELVQDFERMTLESKAKAYSNLSLERPLTDEEFNKYKSVMSELTED